ncbi:hypothetical protein EI555_000041, partial [Monodon monoceros]
TFLLVIGVAGVMVALIPWTVMPLVPLGIIFFVLRQYFLETAGDVKCLECAVEFPGALRQPTRKPFGRMCNHRAREAVGFLASSLPNFLCCLSVSASPARSLVFSHLAFSFRGLWAIRANSAEQKFQEVFDAHQDLHSALDAGKVGLALSLALTLMGMTQWCVWQSVRVENMVIRVIEYTDLEKEAPWKYFFHLPPPAWPHEGKIFFQNVNLRYSLDGPLVLKDLTAVSNSREKVGIVGRTGAGKSSLIAALFRLSEPEGEISVYGILTTITGFHHIRKKMSGVPQVCTSEHSHMFFL